MGMINAPTFPEGEVFLRYINNRFNKNKNFIGVTTGPTGCLSGDTELYGQDKTIEELYKSGKIFIDTYSLTKVKNKDGTYYPIKSKSEIIPSGKKEVYEIELEDGRKVIATSEHKLFKKHKNNIVEIEVKDLGVEDSLLTTKRIKKLKLINSKIKSIKKLEVIETYDLNTPKYENFFLDNGILSHNSGKSYLDLRKAELQHRRRFNEEFPIKNVCFSVAELMERISSGELRTGEILILEEAGVNIGSGDWQNKIVKMFNYILQSFRSMNVGIFMNLPVLSMMSKQARLLTHMHMETVGIDFELGLCKVKPLCHQLNQHTGKSYWKYMRVKKGESIVTVQRMAFGMPSDRVVKLYEDKKEKFLMGITKEFTQQLRKLERAKTDKLARHDLSDKQKKVLELHIEGKIQKEIATIVDMTQGDVSANLKRMEKWGYSIDRD